STVAVGLDPTLAPLGQIANAGICKERHSKEYRVKTRLAAARTHERSMEPAAIEHGCHPRRTVLCPARAEMQLPIDAESDSKSCYALQRETQKAARGRFVQIPPQSGRWHFPNAASRLQFRTRHLPKTADTAPF